MRKYKLTDVEENIICKFEKMSIPYIFKSGIYGTYMQYFEIIDFDVCSSLKNGKYIDFQTYEIIRQQPTIDFDILDEYSLSFVKCYLIVMDITRKYHPFYT